MSESKEQYPLSQKRIEKQKELFLEQLQKTPIVQVVCERLAIPRTTLYRWRREDPAFEGQVQSALEEGTGLINDLAESKLIKRVSEEDMGAIRFWLQAHHKGYSQKVHVALERTPQELTTEEIQDIETSLAHFNLKTPSSYDNTLEPESGSEESS